MFHPNSTFFIKIVYNNGDICLDILKDMWSAIYDVSSILLSI